TVEGPCIIRERFTVCVHEPVALVIARVRSQRRGNVETRLVELDRLFRRGLSNLPHSPPKRSRDREVIIPCSSAEISSPSYPQPITFNLLVLTSVLPFAFGKFSASSIRTFDCRVWLGRRITGKTMSGIPRGWLPGFAGSWRTSRSCSMRGSRSQRAND